MSRFRDTVRRKTHQRSFLLNSALAVCLAGFLVALVVHFTREPAGSPIENILRKSSVSDVARWLETPPDDVGLVFDAIRDLRLDVDDAGHWPLRNALDRSPLDPEVKAVIHAMLDSMVDGAPTPALLILAERDPPVRHAQRALGDVWWTQTRFGAAAVAFEGEGRAFADASHSRDRAFSLYVLAGRLDDADRLLSDPTFAADVSASVRVMVAESRGEWGALALWIPKLMIEHVLWKYAALAAFAGLIWFLFAVQASQPPSVWSGRVLLSAMAVVAGVVSIWPTLFLVYWETGALGLVRVDDLVGGIFYYVAGVGLREELCKVLLFLPFLPILLRRKSELEALWVAGCVGLGFAMEENIGYFQDTAGTATAGRFLTANFFHMAATGLIGLALYRFVARPRRDLVEFLTVFTVVVAAHGLYDAFISLTVFDTYEMLGMICFVLLTYRFFHEFRHLRQTAPHVVSLSATFLLGLALLLAVTYVFLTSEVGLKTASDAVVPGTLELGIIIYLFLREVPDSLVRR